MKGLIVVPCRPDQARHVDFFQSLMALEKPEGTEIRLHPGFFAHDNRTKGIREALESGAEWVFFVDDDQLFEPSALMQLLKHDVDIVTCNFITKEHPFEPYLFEHIADFGLLPIPLEKSPTLIHVDACGLGGVLVKSSVFRALDEPWLAVNDEFKTDDLYFCRKAVAAGFAIHCDLAVSSGHITKGSVWPRWNGQQWVTELRISGGTQLILPPAARSEQLEEWRTQRLAALAS